MKQQDLFVFEVSGVNLGLPLAQVEEVVPASAITRIPRSPPFLLGLAAARGKVMAVIDAARRYGLGPSLTSYFMVCFVRGNLTAVTIDRPIVAGSLYMRELTPRETDDLRESAKIDSKFVRAGLELVEMQNNDADSILAPGIRFLLVDPDLFVSTEMASQVGEAV